MAGTFGRKRLLPCTDSFYIMLKSDSNITLFPKNNSFEFKTKLNKQYILNDNWQVALCDLHLFLGKQVTQTENVWVFSDVVCDTQVGDLDKQLLRRLNNDIKRNTNNTWHYFTLQERQYMPLKISELNVISISIKFTLDDSEKLPPTVKNKPTTLMLHFRRRGYFE